MEVILQQDFPSLGYIGDRVKVKGGYARNFLIPRGIALESSVHNEKQLRHRLTGITARKIRMRADAQELANKLGAVTLEFTLRMGGAGRTFGSITSRDIDTALKKEGFQLDRRQIILPEPLKKAGDHSIAVKLHSEVTAQVTVKVSTDMPEPVAKAEASEGDAPKPERKARARKKKEAETPGDSSPEGEAGPASSAGENAEE